VAGASGSGSEQGAGAAGEETAPDALPEPLAQLSGKRQQWADYSFIAPPGMLFSADESGAILEAPIVDDERCFIALFPLQPAVGTLDEQAATILAAAFTPTFSGMHHERTDGPVSLADHGVAGAGWAYATIPVELELPDGYRLSGHHARVVLARLGDQVAPIIFYDTVANPCLTAGKAPAWSRFFYSLGFAERPDFEPAALAERLLGKWFIGGTGAGSLHVFAANGRYDDTNLLVGSDVVSTTEILLTTTTFQGNGRFVAEGDWLARFPDREEPHTALFRIVEEWAFDDSYREQLYRLEMQEGEPREYGMVRAQ
jgi:hypothetical protein